MDKLLVPTNNQKLNINMDIIFNSPVELRAIGTNAKDRSTKYFDRYIEPGYGNCMSVDLSLPISPKELMIKVHNVTNNNPDAYQIQAIGIDYLQNKGVLLSDEQHKTVEWLMKFCRDASWLPDGIYKQPKGKLWINYMPQIIDEEEGVIDTPARIDHGTGEMQINSTKFRKYTVPIRMVVVSHEDSHWRYDNTDETFCDLEALRICLGLGFPKTECIYTFTNILNDTHQSEQRTHQIVNYINSYK